MVGWRPALAAGDAFDATTVAKTREFQKACGIAESGVGDAATWHALDSFTKADVPFSVVNALFGRSKAAFDVGDTDTAASLRMLEACRDEARALGLTEIEKHTESLIARAHHRLSHFAQALEHYNIYLGRTFPSPTHYKLVLELIRKAHQGLPAD
jgi:peptidoglycan hydrolase-like protein with peptidoglycan-binding domain